MSQSILLPLLADGEYRSGQDLADALGVSRTAVWKQLNKFGRESGLQIESVRGRGYRIAGGLDLLDANAVSEAMNEQARGLLSELSIASCIDSTNSEALRRAQAGCRPGLVCTAEQQSAGRGRRGRQWVSPFASNLYLSAYWQFHQGAAALEGLSLAIGVAVARALATCGVAQVALKWPNDILSDGAKLGGILIEMTGDSTGACQVVVGVGLNVSMPETAGSEIDQSWTDVQTLCSNDPPRRSTLLAALLNELLPMLSTFENSGFTAYREEWMSRDAHADKPVIIDTGAQQIAGVARGVDKRGALQLETSTGVQSIYGGEISLRAAS